MTFLFSLLLATSILTEKDSLVVKRINDPWFSEDKAHHFIHSAVITTGSYLITSRMFNTDERNSIYISISVGTLAGIAKEIFDAKSKHGNPSMKDIIYDVAGVLTGILLIYTGGPDG
ncbi:hypothetical protein KAW18_07025 [candidate division WOR-3 bacterium]|nr:hypothetical protein [candidate division WOR-3 bacterium]MCK4527107.1 hypothetical protein [candidate division WOR-3 bacterium]